MASFQFTGSRAAYHFSARIDASFHASRSDAAGSSDSRTDGAVSSKLIHAEPPQTSQRTGVASRSSSTRLCSAKLRRCVTAVFVPSSP